MKKFISFLFSIIVILYFTFSLSFSETPASINYQGKLTDPDGVALEGPTGIKFTIYDALSGPAALWSDSLVVNISNGLFDVVLGPIPLDFDQPYWMELKVEGEVLAPRQPLSSVPYSLFSNKALHSDTALALHWLDLYEVPPGFLDGIDNEGAAGDYQHNELLELQGGTTDEYFHLTDAQHSEVTTFFDNTDITAAEAEELTDGSDASGLHIHDGRYYTEAEHINTSAGAADAGKPIVLDADGQIDASMLNSGDIDHGSLAGLGDDDHPQYHNDTRGDARYYTQTQLGTSDGDAPNAGSNFVHWDILNGVPDGFSDGIDNTGGAGDYDHNDLLGLLGGTTGEYFHLTDAQHSEVTTFFDNTDITAAEAEELTDGSDASGLHIHDGRYYTEVEHINTSAGAADAGKPIVLDAGGQIDASMLNSGGIDHGSLAGLGDDDHPQYHNDTRGDARYYTQTQLNTSGAGGAVHWDNLTSVPGGFGDGIDNEGVTSVGAGNGIVCSPSPITGIGTVSANYGGSGGTWGSANTLARSDHYHQTLSNGTGLSGSNYNGSAAQSWSVNTASGVTISGDNVVADESWFDARYFELTDDLAGDVTGPYNNTNIALGVVGNNELDDAAQFVDVYINGTHRFSVTDGNQTLDFNEGTGIDLSYNATNHDVTITHQDMSSQGNVDNSGGTIIQDVTLDWSGHVTGLGSYNLDNRYFHTGNDGSGSGLDADMVDGHHYSTNWDLWTAASGYIYANNATNFTVYDNTSSYFGLCYISGTETSAITNWNNDGVYVNHCYNSSGTTYGLRTYGGTYGVNSSGTSYGLYGSGGTYGVYGYGTSYGVYGSGGTYGVYGSGSTYGAYGTGIYGLYGTTSTGSYGIYGSNYYNSTTSWGVYGYQSESTGTGSSNSDMRGGVKGFVFWGTNYSAGVQGWNYGDYNRSAGVQGYNSDFGGLNGNDFWTALAYIGSDNLGYFWYGYNGPDGGRRRSTHESGNVYNSIGFGMTTDLMGGWMDGGIYGLYSKGREFGIYSRGDVMTNDAMVSLTDTGDGRIPSYSVTSIDVDIYTHGRARLNNGRARVKFSENFKRVTSNEIPITVTITPIGLYNQLYIEDIDENGFTIIEAGDERNNNEFCWTAIGRRIGYEETPVIAEELTDGSLDRLMDQKMSHNENQPGIDSPYFWHDGDRVHYDKPPAFPRDPSEKIDEIPPDIEIPELDIPVEPVDVTPEIIGNTIRNHINPGQSIEKPVK